MVNADLHCHSRVSDGLLSPAELIRLAAARGVSLVSLTDHDDVAGLAEAAEAASRCNIEFVTGVEISASWRTRTIHVVGLNFDAGDAALAKGLARVRESRERRARQMADNLAAVGIEGSYEGASAYAGKAQSLSRTHFARFLVERNYARDVKSVFRHYLSHGKPGHVAHEWTSLEEALRWIQGAGGIAVMAHPGRYQLSDSEMDALLRDFRESGGQAVEVVTGTHTPRQCRRFYRLARRFGLAASRGSDYHGPGESRAELGVLASLPEDLKPVWQLM